MGSTRIARRAGMYEASSATAESSAATPAKVKGSVALMPNRRLDIRRVIRNDAAMPRTTPKTAMREDRKSTRLNSSHGYISYAVFCLKKKKVQRDKRGD